MSTSDEVTAQLPGLQFSVKNVQRSLTATGACSGLITLRCTVSDQALFEAAVRKLDGYKVFSSCTEEIITALGMELDSTVSDLQRAQLLEKALRRELAKKDDELTKMQDFLAQLERELGIIMPGR